MFKSEYGLVCAAAQKKVDFFKVDKVGYFVSSMLAGVFVGLGVVVIFVIAAAMGDFAGLKILQGFSFAAALSLIVFAGAELFTGNVFVLTAGIMRKKIELKDAIPLWIYCYLGNLAGSVLIAALFVGTGLFEGYINALVNDSVIAKTSPDLSNLFIRGILCNLLVCAATWCSYKIKSDTGKLIMIFWCIYIFVIIGFEHSIANMTLFSLKGFLWTDGGATVGGIANNLFATTFGNFFGGAMLAMAYWLMGRKEQGQE
ncbi:MAG: formate/nitrite transporter family protein [Defluviitaleaceae bacterium]|nr:formate/nitrite transporter family protein [Defluviitaleaceae bacterium]